MVGGYGLVPGAAFAMAAAVLFPRGVSAQPAATPEEAVARMEAAIRAADVDGVLAAGSSIFVKYLTENYDLRRQRDRARAALDDALDAKFGPDGRADRKPFVERPFKEGFQQELVRDSGRLDKLIIEASEPAPADRKSVTDRVELRIRFRDTREPRTDDARKDDKAAAKDKPAMKKSERRGDPWVAVKEDGGWKLAPKEIQEGRTNDSSRKLLVEQAAKCGRIAKEVAAGKYANRDDALEAYYGFRREDFKDAKKDSPHKEDAKK